VTSTSSNQISIRSDLGNVAKWLLRLTRMFQCFRYQIPSGAQVRVLPLSINIFALLGPVNQILDRQHCTLTQATTSFNQNRNPFIGGGVIKLVSTLALNTAE
jgi:hypothetical protein